MFSFQLLFSFMKRSVSAKQTWDTIWMMDMNTSMHEHTYKTLDGQIVWKNWNLIQSRMQQIIQGNAVARNQLFGILFQVNFNSIQYLHMLYYNRNVLIHFSFFLFFVFVFLFPFLFKKSQKPTRKLAICICDSMRSNDFIAAKTGFDTMRLANSVAIVQLTKCFDAFMHSVCCLMRTQKSLFEWIEERVW